MKIVNVKTKQRNYRIYIMAGIFDRLADLFRDPNGGPLGKITGNDSKIFFITDKRIWELYSEKIMNFLEKSLRKHRVFILVEGEKEKNLDSVRRIYDEMMEFGLRRTDSVVAFGGGVTGDTAGFAASTYYRGVCLIHVPTTIVGQVDSSIGGKVAVNFKNAKNIIGSFYQPHAVFADPGILSSLPEDEVRNGLAEVIKYGLVFDSSILAVLKKILSGLHKENRSVTELLKCREFEWVIYRCCSIKAMTVARDEFDVSYRNLLNFGHTFGHAIEKSSELEGISHGMAVATGMLMALDASSLSGFKLAQAKKDIIEIYGYLNIPVTPSGIDPKKLMDALDFDKKFESGRTKFVLLSAINKPFFSYNPGRDIIEEAVRRNISV